MSTPSGGWVKLWRSWRDHEVSRDAKAWLVLTHLLCRAAITPRVNRRLGYTLQPGQCDETEDQLAQATGLTRKEVRGSLARLGQYGTIAKGQVQGQRRNVITLVNWAFYNPTTENGAKDGAKKGPKKGPRKGQERANPEEVQEVKTTTPAVAVQLEKFLQDYCGRTPSAQQLDKLIAAHGLDAITAEAEARAAAGEAAFVGVSSPAAVMRAAVKAGPPGQTGAFARWCNKAARPAVNRETLPAGPDEAERKAWETWLEGPGKAFERKPSAVKLKAFDEWRTAGTVSAEFRRPRRSARAGRAP
ncbi:MAG: hypothetical protein ICCCNLDF_03724 [Planctomycetes bacterium]|nr:hypothetical protein [Planctomycetota bacterium]